MAVTNAYSKFLAICIVSVLVSTSCAKSDLALPIPGSIAGKNAPVSWAWVKEPWSGHERAYQQTRTSIDKAIKLGQSPVKLMAQYQEKAQASSSQHENELPNTLALFAWGYAAWQAAKSTHNFSDVLGDLSDIHPFFDLIPSPHTYEYARLRFLIEASVNPDIHLETMGKRLVARDPMDYDVKFAYILVLEESLTPARQQQALHYANDLTKLKPKSATPYSLVGDIYLIGFIGNWNKSDGDKAIAAYRKFLSMAPPEDDFRKQAEDYITRIQKDEARVK